MRAPLGLLAITLALACFEEGGPRVTTVGMDDDGPTTSSGSGSTHASETGPSPTDTDPTVDSTGTTAPTETVDTSTGQLPMGICGDGLATPGELCLDGITVVMANAPVVAVRIGPVSGTADPDLVYLIPNQVVIRPGNGSGNFGSAVFDESLMGRTFELADMDGDDQLDLVALVEDGPLRVLLGTGAGFTPSDLDPVGTDPQVMTLGDLDGNGTLDAVIGTGTTAMLVPVLGSGDGEVAPLAGVNGFGAVHGLAMADFTGEGNTDVALAIQGGAIEGVALRPGDGQGGLLMQQTTPGAMSGAVDLAAGDFDGDGNPDLAYISRTDNMLGVLIADGDGGFEPERVLPMGQGPARLVADDLTGNGRDELVVAHADESTLRFVACQADGTPVEAAMVMLPGGTIATDLATGDVNDDGVPDVAVAVRDQNIVRLLLSEP
ncbi:MAG: VCBS repeat-containing protein [Myxococcota bacterium]